MKTLIILLLITAFVSFGEKGFGQERTDSVAVSGRLVQLDSLRKIRPEFYRKSMGIDSLKAAKVAEVQDAYKAALYQIGQDSSLSGDIRRERVHQLMLERNGKLRGILNVEQQSKVIPSTELILEEATKKPVK